MSPYLRRVRALSFQNFSRKAILKLQYQLSQHDRRQILDQKHLRYARRSKFTNQRIATVVSSKPQPCPAHLNILMIQTLSTVMQLFKGFIFQCVFCFKTFLTLFGYRERYTARISQFMSSISPASRYSIKDHIFFKVLQMKC